MTEVKISVSRHSMWNGVRPKIRVEQGWWYTCLDSQGSGVQVQPQLYFMERWQDKGVNDSHMFVCWGPTPRLRACWVRHLSAGSAPTQWLLRSLFCCTRQVFPDEIKQSLHSECLIPFGCFKKILSLGNKKMFVWLIVLKNKNMTPTSAWVGKDCPAEDSTVMEMCGEICVEIGHKGSRQGKQTYLLMFFVWMSPVPRDSMNSFVNMKGHT